MNDDKIDKELKGFIKTYNGFKSIQYFCFGVDEEFAKQLLSSLIFFAGNTDKTTGTNGPDFKAVVGRIPIGIEHFQYDSSKYKKKGGSTEQHNLQKCYKMFENEARTLFIEGSTDHVTREYSHIAFSDSNTLKENFLASFNKHNGKIQDYKRNLTNTGSRNATIWFLAEDRSLMGPFAPFNPYRGKDPCYPVLPIFYQEIQDKLLEQKGLDGIMFASDFPISQSIYFIKNTRKAFADICQYFGFDCDTPIQFDNESKMIQSAFLCK